MNTQLLRMEEDEMQTVLGSVSQTLARDEDDDWDIDVDSFINRVRSVDSGTLSSRKPDNSQYLIEKNVQPLPCALDSASSSKSEKTAQAPSDHVRSLSLLSSINAKDVSLITRTSGSSTSQLETLTSVHPEDASVLEKGTCAQALCVLPNALAPTCTQIILEHSVEASRDEASNGSLNVTVCDVADFRQEQNSSKSVSLLTSPTKVKLNDLPKSATKSGTVCIPDAKLHLVTRGSGTGNANKISAQQTHKHPKHRHKKKQKCSDQRVIVSVSAVSDLSTSTAKVLVNKTPGVEDRETTDGATCGVCGQLFASSLQLHRHCRKLKHEGTMDNNTRTIPTLYIEPKSFPCTECDKVFADSAGLKKHQFVHQTQGLPCSICGKILKNDLTLKKHMRTHNRKISYVCEDCGKIFKTAISLKAHQTHHLPEGSPYKCLVCGRDCRSQDYLQNHLKNKHSNGAKQYQCKTCGKFYKYYKTLEVHAATLHGQGTNVHDLPTCPKCGKRFAHRSVLAIHMMKHEERRDYRCETCAMMFKTQVALNSHINVVHCTGRDYNCDLCGKSFKAKTYLYSHRMNVHSKRTDFHCRHCQKAFKCKRSMLAHEVRHSNTPRYYCSFCGKGFMSVGDLKRHEKVHTGEKNYSCTICCKPFARRDNLQAHMKVHQNDRNMNW